MPTHWHLRVEEAAPPSAQDYAVCAMFGGPRPFVHDRPRAPSSRRTLLASHGGDTPQRDVVPARPRHFQRPLQHHRAPRRIPPPSFRAVHAKYIFVAVEESMDVSTRTAACITPPFVLPRRTLAHTLPHMSAPVLR